VPHRSQPIPPAHGRAEIDVAGMHGRERAELQGDRERCVVPEHHPLCADPDPLRSDIDLGAHHLGRSTRDTWHAVVLDHPVAAIAERIEMAGEVTRGLRRVAGVVSRSAGSKVEN
jgi:hypothetical protein